MVSTARGQPVRYDVEVSAADSADRIGEELSGMLTSADQAAYMGDCDMKNDHCMQQAFKAEEQGSTKKEAEKSADVPKKDEQPKPVAEKKESDKVEKSAKKEAPKAESKPEKVEKPVKASKKENENKKPADLPAKKEV